MLIKVSVQFGGVIVSEECSTPQASEPEDMRKIVAGAVAYIREASERGFSPPARVPCFMVPDGHGGRRPLFCSDDNPNTHYSPCPKANFGDAIPSPIKKA